MASRAAKLYLAFWVFGCLVIALSSDTGNVQLQPHQTGIIPCPLIADVSAAISDIDAYWYKLPQSNRALISHFQGQVYPNPELSQEKYSLTENFSLVINNTTVLDEGTYRCQLKPKTQALRYEDVKVTVSAPPTLPPTTPPTTPRTAPPRDPMAGAKTTKDPDGNNLIHPAFIALIVIVLVVLLIIAFLVFKKPRALQTCWRRERFGPHTAIPMADTTVDGEGFGQGTSRRRTLSYSEEDKIDDFVKELKAFYKVEMKGIPIHPTDNSKTRESGNIFILPELFHRKNKKKIPLNSLRQLKELLKKGGHVVVMGSAGGGRSTLIKKIAYDWACQTFPTFFKIVVILRRKEIQGSSGVVDAFSRLLPSDTEITRQQLKFLIKRHESEMLILMEGSFLFGESSDDMGSPTREEDWPLMDLVSIKALRNCKLLITIGTHQLDLLRQYDPAITVVETEGFSSKNIDKYINQYFESGKEGKALIDKVHSVPIIDTLARFPIMLQLLCLIWEPDNTLPRQTAKLYDRALKMLANHVSKSGGSVEQDPDTIDGFLKEIGKVAVQGLQDLQKEGFPPSDFPGDALDFGLKLGILCQETVPKAEEVVCEVKFLRLAQEYCGAYFLAREGTEIVQRRLLPEVTLESLAQQKMKFFLQFCCGMMGSAASVITTHVQCLSRDKQVQQFAEVLVSEASDLD